MPGVGAQCPRSPGGKEQEGFRSAETGSHLSNQAGQRVSEVQSLAPTSQSRQNKKQNQGRQKIKMCTETRSCPFRPVTVTPSGVLLCKHPTLLCVPHLGGSPHPGP